MNFILIGKVLGAVCFSVTSIYLIAITANKRSADTHVEEVMVDLYVVSKMFSTNDAIQNPSAYLKDFQCQIDLSTTDANKLQKLFDCKVFKLNVPPNKQHDLTNTPESTNSQLFHKDLSTKDNIFQIRFNERHWNELSDKWPELFSSVGKFNLISKTNPTITYNNLNPLIAKKGDDKQFDKISFIAKVSEVTSTNMQTSNSFKCAFEKSVNADIACKITEFSDTEPDSSARKDYKYLTFKKSDKAATTITQHKHYLIQFTDKNNNNQNNDLTQKIIYANAGKKQIATFDIKATAFYPTGNDSVFVLDSVTENKTANKKTL